MNQVLPEARATLRTRPVRILSAACSSGEEPYSLAIRLVDAGYELAGVKWSIDACDLNPARLEQARNAAYEGLSFRACDEATKQRCFESDENGKFRLRERYRKSVRFFQANLAAPFSGAGWGQYDVVLCRNLLIYFGPEAFDRLISRFAQLLASGGYLFLGHSESLFERGAGIRAGAVPQHHGVSPPAAGLMIRVFVVDDSPFVRKAIRRVLAGNPAVTVVGDAASGAEALARIPELAPHVVTLDVEMPGLNGLEVLRRLLAWRPALRVIMLSVHTGQGADATLEALAAGAADFIDKQSLNLMDLERLGRELGERIRLLGDLRTPRLKPPRSAAPTLPPDTLDAVELVVLGASTGGPAALQRLLEQLPQDFPAPIAIVQHMPPGFTRPFATRLDGLCRLTVREAVDGERLEPGQVRIAPAGQHLRLSPSLVTGLSTEPRSARHTPSVDVLFGSAATARSGPRAGHPAHRHGRRRRPGPEPDPGPGRNHHRGERRELRRVRHAAGRGGARGGAARAAADGDRGVAGGVEGGEALRR